MGGYGSGGHNRERVTVEACARVDVAMLRRAGLIRPIEPKGNRWNYNRNGAQTCSVAVFGFPDSPLSLHFVILTQDKERYEQDVRLSFTPCNYGKERPWLHCPLCARRVFRLFYYDNVWNNGKQVHYFACRHCLKLTYDQRRERGFDRYQTQTGKAKDKIKAYLLKHPDSDYPDWVFTEWNASPIKPKGMRWSTFNRIEDKFEWAYEKADGAFLAGIARFL